MDGDSIDLVCNTAMSVVTQNPTFSQSWNGGVMGDCVPVVMGGLILVDLDSVWLVEHPLRCPSRAGVLIECCLLLEEHPPDLVQSFLRAINSTTRHSCWMVLAPKVVCPKGKYGDQWLRNYSWHHLVATAAIPELFGAAKHFCTKNMDGKLSYKYKDIQFEYVRNLDKLKLFRKCMEAFDMFDPFLIPTWIGSMMRLTWTSTGQSFCSSTCAPGRGLLLIGAQMRVIWLAWSG